MSVIQPGTYYVGKTEEKYDVGCDTLQDVFMKHAKVANLPVQRFGVYEGDGRFEFTCKKELSESGVRAVMQKTADETGIALGLLHETEREQKRKERGQMKPIIGDQLRWTSAQLYSEAALKVSPTPK